SGDRGVPSTEQRLCAKAERLVSRGGDAEDQTAVREPPIMILVHHPVPAATYEEDLIAEPADVGADQLGRLVIEARQLDLRLRQQDALHARAQPRTLA